MHLVGTPVECFKQHHRKRNFPGLASKVMGQVLVTGILVKNASDVTFSNNRIDVTSVIAGLLLEITRVSDQVLNNTITVLQRP